MTNISYITIKAKGTTECMTSDFIKNDDLEDQSIPMLYPECICQGGEYYFKVIVGTS